MSTSPENAVASRIARQGVELVDEIPAIRAPTIVLQAMGDRSTTFDNAVLVSASIPGARLVPLQSRNHILLADEPAWQVFIDRGDRLPRAGPAGVWLAADAALGRDALAARARRAARRADGRTNERSPAALALSVRTVERHLSNTYLKLGVAGKPRAPRPSRGSLRGRG